MGVGVVGDDGGVIAASSGKLATVTSLLLQVADDGSLGHVADGHDVADGYCRLLSAVDGLSSVHSLARHEQLLLDLVVVRITEVDDSEGSTTTWVMDDVLDNSLKKMNIQNKNYFIFNLRNTIKIVRLPVNGIINHYPVGSAFSSSGSSNIFHHSHSCSDDSYLDVTVSLSIVHGSQGWLPLPVLGVSSEH